MFRGCETPSPPPLASAPGAGLCTLDKDTWVETRAKVREVSRTQPCEGSPSPGAGGTGQGLTHKPLLRWGWGCHAAAMLRCCVTRLTWRALGRAWHCWCQLSPMNSASPPPWGAGTMGRLWAGGTRTPGFCSQLSSSGVFAGRRMPSLPKRCQHGVQTHLVATGGIRTPQSSFFPALWGLFRCLVASVVNLGVTGFPSSCLPWSSVNPGVAVPPLAVVLLLPRLSPMLAVTTCTHLPFVCIWGGLAGCERMRSHLKAWGKVLQVGCSPPCAMDLHPMPRVTPKWGGRA